MKNKVLVLGDSHDNAEQVFDIKNDENLLIYFSSFENIKENIFTFNIYHDVEFHLNFCNFFFATARNNIKIFVNILGQNTECDINTIALVGNFADRKIDYKINFSEGANNSRCNQNERCFLLDKNASNISIPSVQSSCDNIEAKHGFYSGIIDKKQIEFLQSRGFSNEFAKEFLIQNLIPETFENEFINDYKKYLNFKKSENQIKKIRAKFPEISDNETYFDNAATTFKPNSVIKKVVDFYKNDYASTRRGLYRKSQEADFLMQDARENIASFINTKGSEIVFNYNATNCINLLAKSLPKKYLKKVGICYLEHHSNSLPWRDSANEYYYFENELQSDTTLVAVSAYSNVLGCNNNLRKIISAAHDKGAIVVVDATQAVAHQKISVNDLDADFLVFSGHKIYGPTGVGVLFGKYNLLEELKPGILGGEMVDSVSESTYELTEIPARFEAGTQNLADILGLSAAIDFLKNNTSLWEHEQKIANYIFKELSLIPKVKIFSNKNSTVISFKIAGMHPHDIAQYLAEKNIAVRAGFICAQPLLEHQNIGPVVRVSIGIYNSFDEAKYFVKEIRKLAKNG